MLEYVAPSSAPADKPEESPSGSNQKGRDRRGTVVGRIRVNYTSAGTDGYLASTVFEDAWSTVSSTVDGAALFQFTPAQKTIKYLVSTRENLCAQNCLHGAMRGREPRVS